LVEYLIITITNLTISTDQKYNQKQFTAILSYKSIFVMKPKALAQIEMESPEMKQLIFLAIKERPTEAPFMARKIVGATRTWNVALE
jgi:hypothetical protein